LGSLGSIPQQILVLGLTSIVVEFGVLLHPTQVADLVLDHPL